MITWCFIDQGPLVMGSNHCLPTDEVTSDLLGTQVSLWLYDYVFLLLRGLERKTSNLPDTE